MIVVLDLDMIASTRCPCYGPSGHEHAWSIEVDVREGERRRVEIVRASCDELSIDGIPGDQARLLWERAMPLRIKDALGIGPVIEE